MSAAELLGSAAGMAWVCAVALAGGVAHGLSGFGFLIISTPTVALVAEVRTAVVVTLLPNIAVNVAGASSGEGWRRNLRAHLAMPMWVLVGTVVGTQVVLWAPADVLRLTLVAMLVVYLQQHRLRALDGAGIRRHPAAWGAALGLAGGFFSGTVNVMLTPLLFYYNALGLPAAAMTQVLNACFLVGKASQAAAFALQGQFTAGSLALTVPPTLVAVAGYALGVKLRPRVPPQWHRRFLRALLWTMAALLAWQALAPR